MEEIKSICLADLPHDIDLKIECWEDGSLNITQSWLGTSSHYVDGSSREGYQARGVIKWLFGYLKKGETVEFVIRKKE